MVIVKSVDYLLEEADDEDMSENWQSMAYL